MELRPRRVIAREAARTSPSVGVGAALVALAVLLAAAPRAADSPASVVVTDLRGAIGVAAAQHTCAVLQQAADTNASLVVLRMDTPGGLLTATRELIHCILASPRPVAVYVAPNGARAASAGTYIAQAAHIAAMAPSTHIGAATPVALGPGGPRQPTDRRPDNAQPKQGAEQKAVNDAVAYLKGLAELRGRNTAWAEKAVREADTLTASEALREGVIDIVAVDFDDLLRRLDGRNVTAAGKTITIATVGAPVQTIEPSLRLRLLAALSDPNIAFVLLLVGIYGILFEFLSPGALVPGVVGGISLLLAFISLSVLPFNYGALALLLLGIALMTAEIFLAGFGVLGLGGLAAFVVGAIFLFDPSAADFDLRLAWPVILGAAATVALFSAGVLVAALNTSRLKAVTGSEQLIGMQGQVVAWSGRQGSVHVHGEIWQARSEQDLVPGVGVYVLGRDGLTLIVEPAVGIRRIDS